MVMSALKLEDLPHYTYDDYVLWEDNWELICGYPYAMAPAPLIKHQSISSKIARILEELFENCQKCQVLMPIDWKISEETVVQPDNSVICHTPKNEAYITKAPKIIFEILSKSTAKKDKGVKYDLYEQEGVEYYIIVDPKEEMAKVYKNTKGRFIKICDATDEIVDFDMKECKKTVKFNFGKIW
jgi:Uma2 family endonuclease